MRRFLLITASAAALTIGAGLDAAHAWNDQGSAQHSSMSRDHVTQAQRELQSQGFYQGEVDGIAGPQTRQAVKDYQQKNGLQVTGSLDQQTMDKLGGSGTSGSNATTSSGSAGTSSNSNSGSGLGARLGSMMPKQQPSAPAHGAWQGGTNNSPTTNSTTNSTGAAAPSASH